MTFEKLTKKNAREFFNLYIARKESALTALRQTWGKTSPHKISDLDFSENSLVPLWLWAKNQLPLAQEHPPAELMPPWYQYAIINNTHTEAKFSPSSANLLDQLAYYWGETLIHNIPNTKWDIGAFSGSLGYCCPVVQSDFFGEYPLHNMINFTLIANDHGHRHNTANLLLNVLQRSKETAEQYKKDYIANGNKHSDPRMKKRVTFE